MVVMFQVAELMHDDILDAMDGHLNKIDVKGDPTQTAAASPPPFHGANGCHSNGHTVTGGNRIAAFHISPQSSL